MERRPLDIVRQKRLRELTGDEIVYMAEKLGQELARKDVRASQLRKFLDAVNRIKARPKFDRNEALMLLPRLAYATYKQKGLAPLREVLDLALKEKVQNEEDFRNLARLVEAVVAYHAFHGGRD